LWWTGLIDAAYRGGWDLRDTLVWVKPNANPIHGQVLANSHEYVFIFGDGCTPDAVRTDYDKESLARFTRRYRNGGGVKGDVREQDGRSANALGARARSFFIGYVGREKGNEHPAPMAESLAEHLILLSGGRIVIDPFAGSGTTLAVARRLGRQAVGIEMKESYCHMASLRLAQQSLLAEPA
jgi:DNA modification methylase